MQNISRHVYNLNCTFFHQPDYEEVRSYVQQYLLKNSKSQQSLVESTGQRGYYRLNTTGSKDAQQLMLLFRDNITNDDAQKTLVSASSLGLEKMNKSEQAEKVGEMVAKKALEAGISAVVFDRNGYLYHGRVKKVADAARNAGLKF